MNCNSQNKTGKSKTPLSLTEMEEAISKLYEMFKKYCDIDFEHFKRNLVFSSLEKRLKLNHMDSLEDYIKLLEVNDEEKRVLVKSILSDNSRFFRDAQAFEFLEQKVIPDLLKDENGNLTLRVWVVGCSTGEEAYSLAILLKEHITHFHKNICIEIYATDVDKNAIEYASKGIYPESIVEDVNLDRLNRFFIKKDNKYQVTRQIKDMVEFACHNVITNPPLYNIDFISCRNLMINYNIEVQKRIISLFQFSLNKDGYLFLGRSETIDQLNDCFTICESIHKIYKFKQVNKRRAIDNLSIQTCDFIYRKKNNLREDGASSGTHNIEDGDYKFRQIFDNANDPIFIYSFNARGIPGNIDDVNRTACDILGYSKEELITMTQYDIIAEEFIGEISKINQRLLAKGYDSYEIYYVRKNKTKIFLEISSHIFCLGDEKFVYAKARDITKRKSYEESLRKSKERYKQLVQNSPYATLIINDGKILFTNKAGYKLLGLKHLHEPIGHPVEKYFSNISQAELIDMQKTDMEVSCFTNPVEDKIFRRDGTESFVEIIAMPFWFDGRKSVLMMIRDITAQKYTEDLERDIIRKDRLLNETREYDFLKTGFFLNLSHEFRTPLNVILGTLQLINLNMRGKNISGNGDSISGSSDKIQKYTNTMKNNCLRLLRLVNNMMDITSIDMGFYELHVGNCNIVSVVENITLSASEYIKSKGVSVVFETDIKEKIMAFDRDKVEIILLNLLSNAVKCSRPGGNIAVCIYDYGNKVRISVKDTGIGIPEDKLEVIFERFRQVDKTLTRKHEGSGIGLCLVKAIVEMHDGKIWVESAYGKGSEFSIEFPVRVIENGDGKETYGEESRTLSQEKVQMEFSDINI